MAEQALSDVKVLDLGEHIAAPYCAKMFADYGAEVIKVEPPGGGDPARRAGPFLNDEPHPETSALFLHLNTSKKSLTLNLESKTGRNILKELVKGADILVENFAPGRMAELGLSYEELERLNPHLVMTSITPFGQSGPYRDFKATELTVFAMGGQMILEGWPEREPLKFAGSPLQYFAGSTAAAATMTAFFGSRHQGLGQQVDVSMLEAFLLMTNPALTQYAYSGFMRQRPGGLTGGFPAGIYPTKDGYVMLIALGVRYWPRLVNLMKMPELLEDERFKTLEDRLANEGELKAIFLSWILDKTRQEVLVQGQAERVMTAPVNTIDTLFDDPQFQARDPFVELDHPVAGKLKQTGPLFKMTETPAEIGRAPLLGEHNEEILCGRLGYSREDLVRLRERGVI